MTAVVYEDAPRTRRLTGGDLLMKKLGVNPPVQLLWRTAEPIKVSLLESVHSALARGPLNSRMIGARVPLSRPVWVPHAEASAPTIATDRIDPSCLLDWADAQCSRPLDAHCGRGWHLSAVDLADGTGAVSLTCSHALSDGQGMVAAMTLAVREARMPRSWSEPSLAEDVVDAVTTGARAHARLLVARATSWHADRSRQTTEPAAQPPVAVDPAVRGRVAMSVGADELSSVATERGGNTTALLMAIVANLLRAARGSQSLAREFTVAVPVSFRRPGDLYSSNMVGMAAVPIDPPPGRLTDLSEIQRRCRSAFTRVKYGDHLTGYPRADAALSNLGVIPAPAREAFGPSRAVLFRTVSGSNSVDGRMNSFALQAGNTTSIGLQYAGVHVDAAEVQKEFLAWGLGNYSMW